MNEEKLTPQQERLAHRALSRFAYRGQPEKAFLATLDELGLDAWTQAKLIEAMDAMNRSRHVNRHRRVSGMRSQQRRPSYPSVRVGKTDIELPRSLYGAGNRAMNWLKGVMRR